MKHIKSLVLALMLILSANTLQAQTEVKAPMKGTPVPGEYFSYTSIVLDTSFSFTATAGHSFHAYIQSSDCQPLGGSFSANQNYILTSVPRTGNFKDSGTGVNTGDFAGRGTCDLMQTVQYFDGLGRPMQTVQVKGSPTGKDIVQPFSYDEFGREAMKYLPYALKSGTSNGSYKTDALTAGRGVADFYNFPISGIVKTGNPYSVTVYEPSPLNRTIEQGAPGADWQPAAGHTAKAVYATNNAVLLSDTATSTLAAMYIATANANGSRTLTRGNGTDVNYKAGELYVMVSRDENWKSGRGGTTEEYKDKDGHVILKRVFNYTGTVLQMLSTYYVYDDLGNLAFVLPPATKPDGTGVPATVSSLGYTYRYDERNRLTQKKIPGKGWEFTVYNKLDQPVLTQDSTQRTTNQWMAAKYDAFGRVIMTGLWNAGLVKTLKMLQDSIYAHTQWDVADKNTNTTTYPLGYQIMSYPTLNKVLQINFYDDYRFPLSSFPSVVAGTLTKPTGLLTATKTMVLNTVNNPGPTMQWTVNYYDDHGRQVQTTRQHYLGAVVTSANRDVETSKYNFNDQVISTERKHYTTASTTVPAVTVANQYRYDHVGRKVSTWEQITNGGQAAGPRILVSQQNYNEIGQLWKKHLHSTDSVSFLQDITYSYNERGWLLKSTTPLFSEQLYYNTGTNKQYNGNIAYAFWGAGSTLDKHYTYLYDQLNRLTSGNSTLGNNENSISYDDMGNITALKRYSTSTLIDQLSYTYATNSHKLQSVNDVTTSDQGQIHGITSYDYDGNGNLTKDSGKGITGIAYNLLNLPDTIKGKSITYTYDATGQKLRRINGTDKTDYIGGIQYENGKISFIQTEEGRALANGPAAYNYEYTLTDHLGNSRVNFDTAADTAKKVQADDYYAFGMDIAIGNKPSTKNDYLYNKKELQDGLNWYDYGARFYDPVIARWTSIDPLAELGRRWSPYSYGKNNPVKMVDPDGMWAETTVNGFAAVGTSDSKEIASFLNQLKGQNDSDDGGNKKQDDDPDKKSKEKKKEGDHHPVPQEYKKKGLPGFPKSKLLPRKTGARDTWDLGKTHPGGDEDETIPKGWWGEWDSQHGEIEVYDKQGNHQGARDPETGDEIPNSKVKGRKPSYNNISSEEPDTPPIRINSPSAPSGLNPNVRRGATIGGASFIGWLIAIALAL